MRWLDRCALRWVLLSGGNNGVWTWWAVEIGLEGTPYLGMYVNQQACLLRAGKIKGEGKRVASLRWGDEAGKLIKSTNSPVWSDGEDVCKEKGKGQEKCVLFNNLDGGGIQWKVTGEKCTYCGQRKYSTSQQKCVGLRNDCLNLRLCISKLPKILTLISQNSAFHNKSIIWKISWSLRLLASSP